MARSSVREKKSKTQDSYTEEVQDSRQLQIYHKVKAILISFDIISANESKPNPTHRNVSEMQTLPGQWELTDILHMESNSTPFIDSVPIVY